MKQRVRKKPGPKYIIDAPRSGNQLLFVLGAKFIEGAVDDGDGAINQGATPAAREQAAEVDQGVHVASRALAGVNLAQEMRHLVRSDLAGRALPT